MQYDEFTVFRKKSQKLIDIYKDLRNSEEMGECLDVGKIQCYNVTELLHREL